MNSDQFFCSNAQPQGSHPGSKKCKFLTPGSLLLVKRTQRMIKSPYHGQTCNIKSSSYTWPPPHPKQLNIDRCINLHITTTYRRTLPLTQNSILTTVNKLKCTNHLVIVSFNADCELFIIVLQLERFSIECRKTKTKPITYQLDYSTNLKPQ